jgi:hypothetical protein
MAYLDNSEITVEAILTKKGRQKLASGLKLDITKFALGDDEIDYTFYDINNANGPTYIISSVPITEACSDETQALKHKLVTLSKGITQMPIVTLLPTKISANQSGGSIPISPATSPSGNTIVGYTAVLADQRAGTLIVSKGATEMASIPVFSDGEISTTAQVVTGNEFIFIPNPNLTIDVYTTITVYGNETGGSRTIPVAVTYL